MSTRFLHIASDEKFLNSVNWQFEKVFPGESTYLIYVEGEHSLDTLQYISFRENVELINASNVDWSELLKKLEDYDLILLHGLKFFQSQVVIKASADTRFVWFFWGGELYDNKAAFNDLNLGSITGNLFNKTGFKQYMKSLVKPFYYRLKHGSAPFDQSILQAAKRIEYFAVIHKEDYLFLKARKLINPDARFIKFGYYPVEFMFNGLENMKVSGNNILLGNSASPSNNHLEALNLLKELDLDDTEIIAPLSYGQTDYAEFVESHGKALFGRQFVALRDFMTLEAYNKTISQCSIVVMNHYRQQAMGNIMAMLWMGAKVFLHDRNTIYGFLKRIGVTVFHIDEIVVQNKAKILFTPLTESEVDQNRRLLLKEIGREQLLLDLKNQFDQIRKKEKTRTE